MCHRIKNSRHRKQSKQRGDSKVIFFYFCVVPSFSLVFIAGVLEMASCLCGRPRCRRRRRDSGGGSSSQANPGPESGGRCIRVKMGKRALRKFLQHKRTKATKTVLAHFTLNTALPTVDMTTDILTATQLIMQGHWYWGLSSIALMFLPFAMKVGMLISESILGKAIN